MQSAHCYLPVVATYEALWVPSSWSVTTLWQDLSRGGDTRIETLVILPRDELLTSRHGNDQMSTLAGRLFTKKTVVVGSAILGQC